MSPRLRPGRWLPSRIAFFHLVSLLATGATSPSIAGAQDVDPRGEPYRPGDVVPAPQEEGASEDEDAEEFRDPYGVASEGRH